jgi:hypothetical protein
VVAMSVGDDDVSGAIGTGLMHRVEVYRLANARVDQHGVSSRQEVRPIAGARHRAGIAGMQRNNQKNTLSRA